MANIKKILTFSLIILVLFIVGFLGGLALRNIALQNNTQGEPVKYDIVTLELKCGERGGTWKSDECESIDEATCKELGGEFNPCESPCRDIEGEVCATVCVEVCTFVNVLGLNNSSEIILDILAGDESTQQSFTNDYIDGESAFSFLERTAKENSDFTFEYEEFSLGMFITTINGVKADSNSEFWSFKINGNDASVGVSDYILKNGDVISFELTKF